MKNNSLIQSSIVTLLITIVLLALVHFVVVYKTNPIEMVKKDWWLIHLFMGVTTLSGFFLISNTFQRSKKVTSIGKTYFVYTGVKVALVMAFLSPWLFIEQDENSKFFIIHFFAIFFPYLFVETILLIKYLNRPLSEKSKSDENQS